MDIELPCRADQMFEPLDLTRHVSEISAIFFGKTKPNFGRRFVAHSCKLRATLRNKMGQNEPNFPSPAQRPRDENATEANSFRLNTSSIAGHPLRRFVHARAPLRRTVIHAMILHL